MQPLTGGVRGKSLPPRLPLISRESDGPLDDSYMARRTDSAEQASPKSTDAVPL